jgi:tRNA nucleotidyltransferase/poly(A) polymerase
MHRRTSGSGLSNDYRPGVELAQGAGQHCIDLSNEFERQFFGDLMLFTTEALVKVSDVNLPFAKEKILEVIGQKEQELLELYQLKHQDVLSNCQQLNELVFNQEHWWLDKADLVEALQRVNEFINNIQRNFGDQSLAWRQIQSSEYRAARKQQIVEALMSYRSERDVWDLLVQQHC